MVIYFSAVFAFSFSTHDFRLGYRPLGKLNIVRMINKAITTNRQGPRLTRNSEMKVIRKAAMIGPYMVDDPPTITIASIIVK
jgi:hypothetical protein